MECVSCTLQAIYHKIAQRKLFNTSYVLMTESQRSRTIGMKPRSEVRVVIIGAGLSGLSATHTLLKNGFTSTVLLEASERYGGRINSQRFGDAYCELGAKWIAMDVSRHSVYELLQIATTKSGISKKLHQSSGTYYVYPANGGQMVKQQHMPQLIEELFQKLCSGIELHEKYKAGELHDLNNLYTYFRAEGTKSLKSLFHTVEEQTLAEDVLDSLCKQYSSLLGSCLEYVNIEHITSHKPEGNKTPASPIYIPTGLNNLLYQLTSEIDDGHIRVGKPVGQIAWQNMNTTDTLKKHVGCMDGTSFSADHIICTLPLGVLKNFSSYMFKPKLPKEKLDAIANLGFGNPIKIYLEYKRNIRPWFKVNAIRPLWRAVPPITNDDLKWIKQVVEISVLPTSSHVLEVQVGGAYYNEIEKLPDEEIVDEVTNILRASFQNCKIPYPSSLLRSNWSLCACYLGGRPYFSVASSANDVKRLAAPLGNTLFFAGDATTLSGFGTVDGARRSGIREAHRIIEYYDK